MDYKSVEISKFLTSFKSLIHKTLQRLNIYPQHMDYDDYFQELQIHLLNIQKDFTVNSEKDDKETNLYMFTAYASQGLYWHGINLVKKKGNMDCIPLVENEIEWLIDKQQCSYGFIQSNLYLEDFFKQARKILSDVDYLLLIYLSYGQYTIEEISELMHISRSTIYQRKEKIQGRLQIIKNCLKD